MLNLWRSGNGLDRGLECGLLLGGNPVLEEVERFSN